MLFEKIHLEDSETVITTVRKHWFIVVAELFGVTLFAAVPLIAFMLYSTMPRLADSVPDTVAILPVYIFSSGIWLLLTSFVAMVVWTHYYLDIWIITDRRIIVVEQVTLWHRTVGSFRLERLQDIQVTVQGIVPTLLNFGTVHAQTASAAESNFTTTGLPDPRGLQSTIQSAMDARLQHLNHSAVANH